MAKIVPYGDLNAHGSLAGSVSFRRRYNYVVFQKKPYPKQPNSAGQIAQRTNFKSALTDWYGYDYASKEYFRLRGAQLGMTGLNLFIRAKLLNIMPSTSPILVKEVLDMQIINLRGTEEYNFNWTMESWPTGWGAGGIYDTQNVFGKGMIHPTGIARRWAIKKDAGADGDYLFRDGIWTKLIDSSDVTREIICRVPSFTVTEDDTIFYIADDGSLFYDEALIHLAATNNF